MCVPVNGMMMMMMMQGIHEDSMFTDLTTDSKEIAA